MTWYIGEMEYVGLQGHFIDGYECLSPTTAPSQNGHATPSSRIQTAVPIYYGAKVRRGELAGTPNYPAIANEFQRDSRFGYCAYLFVVRMSRRSADAVMGFPPVRAIEPKTSKEYDDPIAFTGDVIRFMSEMILLHTEPELVERHTIRGASLDVVATLEPRHPPF